MAVGMGVAVRTGVNVGNGIAVGTDVGTGAGDGVGATVAVGKGSTTGNLVGKGRTTGTGVRVGAGVLVGTTTATGKGVLTGAEMAVGMGVGAIDVVGSRVANGRAVSPTALPRVTNTAATVTAVARNRPNTIGTTGKELREVNSWCCLTSRSSKFSRRKSTEPILSNKEMNIANSIHTPPKGTSQAGPEAQTHQPHQSTLV